MKKTPDIRREYPPVPLVGVGALIVNNDRVVLVRRRRKPAQGEWSIPGGLVKLGETLKEAVIREALEETGLNVEPRVLVELLERIFADDRGGIRYHYVIADYLCTVVGGSLTAGSDAAAAVWADRSELHWYALPAVTLRVVLDALDGY
ncbi:MAG: NUDIX domain-containing protein [Desulfomonilaceae bacterium]|nr:NUDIX domain-containing protein [Desulfomonilaceae bacterium]